MDQFLGSGSKTSKTDPLLNDPIKELRSALTPDEVFLDFYKYNEPDLLYRPTNSKYALIVTSKSGEQKFVDIGQAKDLDKVITRWLNRFSIPPDSPARGLKIEDSPSRTKKPIDFSQIVDEFSMSIWKKISPAIDSNCTKIIISPDSELAEIPWDALVNSLTSGTTSVSIEDSPRSIVLARQSPVIATPQKIITLAGAIDFDSAPSLVQTEEEINTISAFAQKVNLSVRMLRHSEPTKTRLIESMSGASYIHLATHGFFASNDNTQSVPGTYRSSVSIKNRGKSKSTTTDITSRNPLLLSGLLVAPSKEDRSGEMTARELIGIRLDNCDLITLSACQTALGELHSGQGVMGLRAALEAAGCMF